MLFNSLAFLIFLVVALFLHWIVFSKTAKWQNLFLLAASFGFYSFWDWRFLFLLLFSISFVFLIGIRIDKTESEKARRVWMIFGVFTSIGILFFFKYYNFFLSSFLDFAESFGLKLEVRLWKIILPIAISFYTFHGISYLLDIYHKKIKSTSSWLNYALFVSYFPLLVAGPIERATHLLPQLKDKRRLKASDVSEGISLILWGFFKKVAVADSLGSVVNLVFENTGNYSSVGLVLAAVMFAVQIYADFSGYTDIARGVSRLFGIELLLNFNFPFFSRSITEFWSRWHISLSSFLNDYVFLPLALFFRNRGKWGIYFSIFLTFLISGFWHGAGWNYVFWGVLHGLFYLPYFLGKGKKLKSIYGNKIKGGSWIGNLLSRLSVFGLVVCAMIFFRSETIQAGFTYFGNIFFNSKWLALNEFIKTGTHAVILIKGILASLIVLSMEYLLFRSNSRVENLLNSKLKILGVLLLLFVLGSFENSIEFIYFQF